MKTPIEIYQTLFPEHDALEVINAINKADYIHTTLILVQDHLTAHQITNDMATTSSTGKSQWRIETELTLSRAEFLILISPETWNEDHLHQYLQKMRTLNPFIHIWMFGIWDNYYDDDFEINLVT